jgi:hypothetical protein
MRKIYTFLSYSWLIALAVLLSIGGAKAQTNVTIGSGTGTSTFWPNYYLYNYSYTQQIVLATEVTSGGWGGGAGLIQKIRFLPGSSVSTTNWKDWVIYIGNTTKTTFASTTDWVAASSMTQVFNGTLPATVTNGVWMEITLTTPFVYDGTSNIVVAIDENTSTYGNSPGWKGYAPGANRGIYYYSDPTNPDPASPPTASGRNLATANVAQMQFEMTSNTPCSGTPTPGNTVSSTNPVCSGVNFNLSLQNPISGSGITYQWQSADDAAFTVGVTNLGTSSTQTTSQTSAKYYRCNVTCTNSGMSAYSNALQVTMEAAYNCYCTSTATYASDEDILNVTFGTLNNTSTCSTTGTGPGSVLNMYSNYKSGAGAPAAPNVTQGDVVSLSLGLGTCGGSYGNLAKVFIDWNQNGLFTDAGEEVYLSPGGSGARTVTGSVTVPLSAVPGNTGMRVVFVETTTASSVTPCGTYSWGETEDYLINVMAAAACAGTPEAGTITAPLVRPTCGGATPTPATAAATGYTTGVTGISLQWEVSTDNVTYTNASGPSATTATYTLPTHTAGQIEYYRMKITCANSGSSDYSDVVVQVTDPSAPGTQASNITPSNVSNTTATASWTNGSGTRRVVYLNSTNSFTDPVNGSGPALVANAAWQNAGQQIIYDGTGTTVNITGLSATTTYYVRVYDYIRCGSGPYDYYYNTSTATDNPNSFTTTLYCTPTTTDGNTYYVSNFTTTGGTTNINNTSGGSATGYQDFHTTATMSADAGTTINYSMTVAGGSTYGRAIWVDLDEDGVFQATEQLVSSSAYASSPLTGSFTIPVSASNGNKRMRIVATFTPNNPSNACSNSGSGEFEDYTLMIMKVNDDCAGAISISSDPITDFIDPGTQFMSNATKSSVPDGSCFTTSPSSKDMWYKITTNGDNGSVLNLTVTPDASMDVALTLFDGTCGTLNAVACSNANSAGVAENMVYTLPLWDGGIEVRANKVYFLRVTDIGGNGTSFTIGNNGSTALPLTLLSFKAQQVKRGEVLLDWRVKDEVNMKQYDVQRSVDGKNFTTIGTVNNLGKEVYTLIDQKPAQGINYYRLSMVEASGLTDYSHIVAININDGKALHASPNPVTGDLTVEVKGEVGKQAVIDIIDYTGNKVRTVAIPAGKVTVDMTSLPTGVYVVQYIDGTTVYTTRVVKM